jgi:hypothetical protein
MKFTVTWSPTAEMRLADKWMVTDDRAALSRAAFGIDALLAKEADQAGASRDGGRRILHVPPLGIIYTVNVADRTVLVLNVWQYSGRA